jgi:putative tricarboxylic transport membrane protein
MPKATAALVGAFGIVLVVQGITNLGDRLEAWSLRGPLFLLGAVVVFGATVRTLGLVAAGPAAVLIASMADRGTRLREILPFAVLLTAACILLFRFVLRQPIPVAPLWLGY